MTPEDLIRRVDDDRKRNAARQAAVKLAKSDELPDLVAALIGKKRKAAWTIEELSDTFDVSVKRVRESLSILHDRGMNLHVDPSGGLSVHRDGIAPSEPTVIDTASFRGKRIRFGLTGDNHLCSRYARMDVLNALFDIWEADGITDVYQCGNMIDGEARFNKFDLVTVGMQEQVDYFVEHWPKRKGITTHFVTGDDHEGWWCREAGVDIGRVLQNAARDAGRDDLRYLGHMEHDVILQAPQGRATMRVIHAGGGCFTEDCSPEILTRSRGWVRFADLTKFDEVATMNPDSRAFEWQRPTAITDELYSGKVFRLRNRVLDCEVTPDHRFMVRNGIALYHDEQREAVGYDMPQKAHRRVVRGWQTMTAQEIVDGYRRQLWQFPTACEGWQGELTPTIQVPHRAPRKYASTPITQIPDMAIEDAAELVAWYVAEGHAHKSGSYVTISQYRSVNPENHAAIVDLFGRLGLGDRVAITDKSVRCRSVALTDWLVSECGRLSASVHLPQWLKNQPTEILRIVLDVLIRGDGWRSGRGFGYRSISRQLAADVCEIAQKCGFGITTSGRMANGKPDYSVQIRTVQNTPTLNTPPEEREYSGRIYCCTVPNGLIYVRTNGKAFWSHNSAYATSYAVQKIVESYQGGEKPNILLVGHYHKAEYGYPREVHTVQCGATQDQTPFLRKLKIQSQIGGWTVEFEQDERGLIHRFAPMFHAFYDRDFYKPETLWRYEWDRKPTKRNSSRQAR